MNNRPPGMVRAEADFWQNVGNYERLVENFEEVHCRKCPLRFECEQEKNVDNCIARWYDETE